MEVLMHAYLLEWVNADKVTVQLYACRWKIDCRTMRTEHDGDTAGTVLILQ